MGDNPGFIDLTNRPGHGGGGGMRGPPPPPPPPGGPGPMRGPPMPMGGPPMQPMGGPHMPPQQMPFRPPPPNRDIIPLDIRVRQPLVSICDLSEDLETMTDDDMINKLTEYVAMRFEKVSDQHQFDEDGQPSKPTWKKAIKTWDQSLSSSKAAFEVRRLNQYTESVTDKKKDLGVNLQRQLEKTTQDFNAQEHDTRNFVWTLVQLESQIRTIAVPRDQYAGYHTKHSSNMSRQRRASISGPRPSSSSKKGLKTYKERISLTAYFRRAPRENVDLRDLYLGLKPQHRGSFPHHGPPIMIHQNPLPEMRGPPMNGPHPQFPPPGPHNGGPLGPGGPRPPGGPPGNPAFHGGKPMNHGGKPPKVYRENHSDHGSSTEYDSDGSRSSSSFSRSTTTGSSSSRRQDRRRRHASRSRSRPRPDQNPAHFGLNPRVHVKDDPLYAYDVDMHRRRSSGLSGSPGRRPSAQEIERIRDEAYIVGRQDEQAKTRTIEEMTAREGLSRRPPALIIEAGGNTRVRRGARGVYPRDLSDEFNRLAIDDRRSDESWEYEARRHEPLRRRESAYRTYSDSWGSDEEPGYYPTARREYMPGRDYDRSPRRTSYATPLAPQPPLMQRRYTEGGNRFQPSY